VLHSILRLDYVRYYTAFANGSKRASGEAIGSDVKFVGNLTTTSSLGRLFEATRELEGSFDDDVV
jgi:hypothetical protein